MNVGALNRAITIEHQVDVQEPIYRSTKKNFATFAGPTAASIEPQAGKEVAYADQTLMQTTHKVTIRAIPGVNAKMRIKHIDPILQTARYFNILGVNNWKERYVYQTLLCVETPVAADEVSRNKANMMQVDLLGAAELSVAFGGLTLGMRNRGIKKAVTKAARVLVSPLRQATPVADELHGKQAAANPPGTMRKSTGLIYRRYKSGDVQSCFVGHKWPRGAAAHLVEAGTTMRMTKTGTPHSTGRVPPMPFFGPVWARLKSQVQSTLRDALASALDDERQKALATAVKKSGI